MLKVLRDRGGIGRKWLPAGGLLLLSLLWAVGWVRADLSPGSGAGLRLNPLWSEAALLGAFAVLAAIAGVVLKKRWPIGTVGFKALLVGLGLFVVPAVLNAFIRERIEDTTRVALFSLTPLFAVIFERHLRTDEEQTREIRGSFAAAMAAVAGTLLVFPVGMPMSYGSAFAMLGIVVAAAAVAAANCAGVETVQVRGVCPLTLAAVSAGSAAMLLGIAGLIVHRGSSTAPLNAWAVSDVLALALLFWLMRHMSAAQMTTRFLVAPLLANLISLALLRPHVGIQSWTGLMLIAAGAGWMLWAPTERGDTLTTIGVGE